MKVKQKKLLLIIGIIIIPLFLLLSAYYTTLFITNYTPNQQLAFDFLDNPVEFEDDLVEKGATSVEISHMQDVSKIMNYTKYAFFILLLVLTLLITYTKKNKKQLQKMFMYGGISSIVFPLVIAFFASISFYKVFTIFHYIFFPQGNWQFSLDSFLIQTFPLSFFQIIALKIFFFTLFYASIFIALSLLLLHDLQNKRH